ncbi:MAG: DNA repair protein RecN [Bacteroidia bacterium]|nr:DNA repair protein RecN [Bacteroidia bacterium]
MLKHLHIKNYALFADCNVTFGKGLNILTGETGAGKSLLVGALGLLMGKRSDANVVFKEEEKCIVEATFVELSSKICQFLKGFEAFDMDGNSIIVRRELNAAGRTRVFINDTPVSVQVLKDVMGAVVDMHSQNESQLLLEPARQMELLDDFAGAHALTEAFENQLKVCNRIQSEIRQLEAEEATARQQFDYFSFLVQELSEANLQAEEEENLEQELQILQNATEIREALRLSTEQLYNQEVSAYQLLSESLHALQKVEKVDVTIAQTVEKLSEWKEGLKETCYQLQNLLENVEENPERLAFIEERLNIYFKLKRKYNVKTGAELIQLLETYSLNLERFSNLESSVASLKEDLVRGYKVLEEIGLAIEQKRTDVIPGLENNVNILLREVGFKDARFIIKLTRTTTENGTFVLDGQPLRPQNTGFNKVVFLIQTNPGLPVGELASIASGGEVSRVMLAIKSVLADKSEFPVLIFDEIDTGISGETANKVGTVMQKLARPFQILSITHLPQIAAKGNHHFLIFKETLSHTTFSGVKELSEQERVMEIAKMIGGDNPTENAMRSASELMRN